MTSPDRALRLHWFLPTGGDARDVVPRDGGRTPSVDYLSQVAGACDHLGFDAVLTPCGTACEDAWIATAAMIGLTERLRFLVAFRPGLLSPTLAAQMASSHQRLSGGRTLVNIVVGAEAHEVARYGDFADKDTRYARADEFLTIMRAAWGTEPVDLAGEHYRVENATTRLAPDPAPGIYFGGASASAEQVGARHADVYLTWGEPPDMVRERLERMRQLAESVDRLAPDPIRFGIRFHVIARDTGDQAWEEAARLLAGMDPAAVATARAEFASTASVGQQRMAELSRSATSDAIPEDPRQLEVHPNLWSGIGLVRGGAGTALVGSHSEVADRIEEYAALGIDEFILSGYPHLEEAYRVAEGPMAELRRRGRLPSADVASSDSAHEPISTFR